MSDRPVATPPKSSCYFCARLQALGNHDFVHGPATLAAFIRNASFPVLSCNLDASAEPSLRGLVQRYTVVQLPISGARVGVVGLSPVDTAATSGSGKRDAPGHPALLHPRGLGQSTQAASPPLSAS